MKKQTNVLSTVRPNNHTVLLSALLFFAIIFSSCSNNNDCDKFIGKWKGECHVEITKNGGYYQWKDDGSCFGIVQLKCVNGELQSGSIMGNVTYTENGHIYMAGHEFKKVE